MHRYRIVAQISLILSILNLVLAAPIVVQGTHEARRGGMVVAEEVAAVPKKWRKLEAVDLSPRAFPDAMACPEHASPSEVPKSSGHPTPPLSSGLLDSSSPCLSESLLDRPQRLSPDSSASLQESASPHSWSSPFWEIIPSPRRPASEGSLSPYWEINLSPPPPAPHRSISGSWEIPPSPQHTGPDWAMTETYSLPDQFSPSHHPPPLSSTQYLSASGGSLPSLYYSLASDGSVASYNSMQEGLAPSHDLTSDELAASYNSMPEGLAPSHDLTSDVLPPSSPSRPTETPPDNAEFFNKNMMKKIGIVVGVAVVSGTIASIVGSEIKHHEHRHCQDS